MRIRIALAAIACTLGVTAAAVPADAGINKRQHKQQVRISKGINNGSLTARETNQLQRQSEEIARLRGQVETLTYELETAKKRQQDFYLDLDTRLRKFEGDGANAAVDPGNAANPKAAADPARESQEYEAALSQFKAGKYKEAAASFGAFVQKSPDSSLAPNAQYWLGNAWYAQRDCKRAIDAQTVVTAKYANSPKAPDAWLAIATCQQELGNGSAAKRTLESLLSKYPNTPAAENAQQRLKKK